MYQKNILREYIENSELRIFSEQIKVRLSKELADKYDRGGYYNGLKNIQNNLDMISSLGIKYPGNAHPILYVYIVPDENYAELLNFQTVYIKGNGGGKPVRCFDLDGFNSAYGLSQNMLENLPTEYEISQKVNEIHELAHIVHSQFFSNNQTIEEGFAETLPLYALDFEKIFDDHRNALINLREDQIFSAQELLNSEKNGAFGAEGVTPNRSCSFRLSYISSYLLVRGCVETIVKKYDFSKAQAIQKFLQIVKESDCRYEWLIYDIANAIGVPQEELLDGKQMQMGVLKSLSTKEVHLQR